MEQSVNIVKIGSDSINENNLEKIIEDAKKWENETWEKFIFISSWAVKLGKDRVEKSWKNFEDFSKSSLATIGQSYLMQLWDKISQKEKLVWEILLDDYLNKEYIEKIWIENKDILSRIKHSLNFVANILNSRKDKKLASTLVENLQNDVWSIINHNDALSDEELNKVSSKTDNDKNAVYISKVLQDTNVKVKRVIYLTNTNWLLDRDKKTILGWKINSQNDKNYYKNFVEASKSNSWTWWMESKLNCGFEVLEYWAKEVIISKAKQWLECLKDDFQFATRFELENKK